MEASPHQQATLRCQQFYPEIQSDSTGKGLTPPKPALYFRCQLQAQVATYASDQQAPYKLEVPLMPTSGSINLLQWVTELRKTSLLTRLLIHYKRILKDMSQQPDKEIDEAIHRARSWTKELLCSWHMEAFWFPNMEVLKKWAKKLSFGDFKEMSLYSHN